MNFSNVAAKNWLQDFAKWLPALMWTGWIIVAFLAAKVVWIWVLYFTSDSEIKPYRVAASKQSAQASSQIDVSKVVDRNLFGSLEQVAAAPVVKQENVEETRLNLKLRGIYAADTQTKANAIIEDGRGKQAVYFIGEKLKVAGRVFLRQVEIDRVILETNGRREALKLQKEEMAIKPVKSSSNKNTANKSAKRIEDKRKNKQISQKLNQYRDKFQVDPRSVSDVITGRPHVVNGELRGFKIQPGKDKRLFQELGLRRGDLVTSINGVALTNMQDAMTLMNDAKSMQEVNVEIQRGNEQLSLLLDLNQ